MSRSNNIPLNPTGLGELVSTDLKTSFVEQCGQCTRLTLAIPTKCLKSLKLKILKFFEIKLMTLLSDSVVPSGYTYKL